jgi:hypothetical protein
MEVQGNLVAIHHSAGILLVDVIDPAGPEIVGVIDIGDWRAQQIALSDNLLHVNVDDVDLWTIDVSEPSVPFVVSEFENIAGGTGFGVDAGESVAYIQSLFGHPGAPLSYRLEAFDYTDPAAPVSAMAFASGGSPSNFARGFMVIRSNPGFLQRPISSFVVPSAYCQFTTLGTPGQVARSGKYLYVSSSGATFEILYDCSVFADGFDFGRTTAWSGVVE